MSRKNIGTVLVVDDDPAILDAVSALLDAFGFSVIACNNASDALKRFQAVTVDAVLTDIVMPAVSGIDLLEKIHDIDPLMPVLLMTGFADFSKTVDAIKRGAFDFIIKPYKSEQLLHSIRKAIKFRKLEQMEDEYKSILEELNRALETIVAERTMSLMALTVADKVRNPATVIGGLCRRMLEKGKYTDSLEENLRAILSEVRNLETIVVNFQGILKSRQSMYAFDNINAVIESIVPVIEKEADQKDIDLVMNISPAPLVFNMQKNLLKVAVFHVLRNAVEATSWGGKITIGTSGNRNHVIIEITDTGPGMSEETVGKIFDPFYSTKECRFGMGLPMVRQIVSEHMGEIKAESEIGKGTTIRMSFPVRWKGQN